jgi:hypothetical protein
MPRKKKQDIKVNNNDSLEGVMQETYNDACLQISDSQRTINELSASATPVDVDDLTKIAREKGNLLKLKDSAIRIKLELAKLQSDIIKNRGNVEDTVNERSNGSATLKDFNSIRQMIMNPTKNNPENTEE